VPVGVSCIRITVEGPGTTVSRLFPVTANQGATLSLTGLPVGADTFIGDAFGVACPPAPTVVPTWTTNPVLATISPTAPFNVALTFVQNGHGTVTTQFSDAGGDAASPPNTVSCDGTGCVCATGFGNCDGTWADGCEANLASDPANCGACGNACMGTCMAGACSSTGLNPGVAPGGNFDLSVWELQEPIGSPGMPTVIPSAQLVGANGFHDNYFFTNPMDGSMTFWDPENGVTTANEMFPSSQLREMTAGGALANWSPAGTNVLTEAVKVTQVPDHVCVAQIRVGTGTPASTQPLAQLFYYSNGNVVLSIEQSPAGGNAVQTMVANFPLGIQWSFNLGLSNNTITLFGQGFGAAPVVALPSTFSQENFFFTAGDFDQATGTSATVGAQVQYYALQVGHQ
jgi:hypothetical protein